MFIVHGAWVRKHMRWLLAAILVLLIPGFIALFTRTDTDSRRRGQWPKIRGKPVDPTELQNAETVVHTQYLLNSGGKLSRTPQLEERMVQEAVIQVVLLRQAREFGIRISDEELVRQLQSEPMFRAENGQFDPDRYRQLVIRLNNFGVSETQFEEMRRQQLTLQRLQELVSAGADVTPEEAKLAYAPLHEKVVGDYLEFDAAALAAPVTVAEADVKAFFEKHQQQFRLPAKVKVRYARFAFDPAKAAASVTDKDVADFYERNKETFTNSLDAARGDIRQQLVQTRAQRSAGDRATEFSVKLVPDATGARPDFVKIAQQFGGDVHETGLFSQREAVPNITADARFNQTAFALMADAPFSDPVEGRDAFYVLELLAAQPSTVPAFDQVKPEVVDQLKKARALEATVKLGQDTVTKIKDLMAKGKSFAQAAAELKLTVKNAEPFSFSDENLKLPAAMAVKEAVLGMPVNGISDLLRTAEGGIIFHLKQRLPPDPAQFAADRAQFTQAVREHNRQALWQAWVTGLLRSEQVNFPTRSGPAPQAPPAPESESEEPAPAPAKG